MRDPGLRAAIEAAGGVSELARRVGISQPSVSNWDKVPAERVLAVESTTGVSRVQLRPDLYAEPKTDSDIDEIDLARAQEYALLAALLSRAPGADLLTRLSSLGGDASPLGMAHIALGEAAARLDADAVQQEYFNSTSVRSRACAPTLPNSGSCGPRTMSSPKITPQRCARSCPGSPAGVFRPPRARNGPCSTDTWRHGSDGSSPIWSAPRRLTSTAA